MQAIKHINIELMVVLGTATLRIGQFLKMGRGAIIILNVKENDPLTILANGRAVAMGRVIIHGEHIAIAITELIENAD